MPEALLSRFDVLFILIDKFDSNIDKKLAEHVTNVHATRQVPEDGNTFKHSVLRAFINKAKSIVPTLPCELTQ